jgi:hypothetical protein
MLLVKEAGGIVRAYREDRKVSIIAGNRAIVDQVFEEVKQK